MLTKYTYCLANMHVNAKYNVVHSVAIAARYTDKFTTTLIVLSQG